MSPNFVTVEQAAAYAAKVETLLERVPLIDDLEETEARQYELSAAQLAQASKYLAQLGVRQVTQVIIGDWHDLPDTDIGMTRVIPPHSHISVNFVSTDEETSFFVDFDEGETLKLQKKIEPFNESHLPPLSLNASAEELVGRLYEDAANAAQAQPVTVHEAEALCGLLDQLYSLE